MGHDEDLIQEHESQLINLTKNVDLIKYTLGMKDVKNGERDKLLNKLESRIEKIGDKTEQEDKTLFEHVMDIKTGLGNKADKKELPSNWVIYVNTALMAGFFLIIFFQYAKDIIPKLLGC